MTLPTTDFDRRVRLLILYVCIALWLAMWSARAATFWYPINSNDAALLFMLDSLNTWVAFLAYSTFSPKKL